VIIQEEELSLGNILQLYRVRSFYIKKKSYLNNRRHYWLRLQIPNSRVVDWFQQWTTDWWQRPGQEDAKQSCDDDARRSCWRCEDSEKRCSITAVVYLVLDTEALHWVVLLTLMTISLWLRLGWWRVCIVRMQLQYYQRPTDVAVYSTPTCFRQYMHWSTYIEQFWWQKYCCGESACAELFAVILVKDVRTV